MSESLILDHREMIREELESRQRKNPAYSARAFARLLGLSSGYLSDLLKGEKLLSEKRGHDIARALKWRKSKAELFVLFLRYARTQDSQLRNDLLAEIASKRAIDLRYQELSADEFQLIAQWYHLAILELTRLKEFPMTPASLAERFRITETQAGEALRRLCKLKILKKLGPASYVRTEAQLRIPTQATRSLAISKYHTEILQKAVQAIAVQPIAARDNTGLTVAIAKKQLPEVKRRIDRFREELAVFCETDDSPDAVYQLSLHFFALDHSG